MSKRTYFWSGWILALAMMSLMQDIMGKADYLAYVSSHWVSGTITVPLAVILSAVILLFIGLDTGIVKTESES